MTIVIAKARRVYFKYLDQKQRQWIGHPLGGDSQLRKVIKEKSKERRKANKKKAKADWMLTYGYGELTEEAQYPEG